MSGTPHPFDRVRTQAQQAMARQADLQYESRIVNQLLVALDLKQLVHSLLELCERREGSGRLTLADFNTLAPEFPALLRADRLAGIHLHTDPRSFLPALFTRFADAPFIAPYSDFCDAVESEAAGRAIGLVFPRKGFPGGLLLHNGGLENFWVHGMVMHYHGGTAAKPYNLYVQSFAPLIKAIRKSGWRPG